MKDNKNNGVNTWLRANAIAELTGYSVIQIRRLAKQFRWQRKRYQTSTLKFYSLADIENSFGVQFTVEQISSVAERLNKPAIFTE